MKSSKEIKDKVLIMFKSLLGDKGRTLWILAIVGGFFAANLRQNGRLSLIHDSTSVTQTFDGDYEFDEYPSENLCGLMFNKYQKENFNYYIKTGRITKEHLEKELETLAKEKDLIRKGDYEFLFDLSENERETAFTRFIQSCETTLDKTAKSGFWWTVGVWSFFSWIGLKIASEIKD